MINIFFLAFTLNAIIYLLLGTWVVIRRFNKINILYGLLCLTTCSWQGIWSLFFSKSVTESTLYLWTEIAYSVIVFIPPVLYHFLLEFTKDTRENPWWLRIMYFGSTACLASIWLGKHLFIRGFYPNSWGMSAKAGIFHPLFVLLIVIVILRMLLVQIAARRASKDGAHKKQMAWILAATLIYSGGAVDIFSNYGIPIFPSSFIFTGIALAIFFYVIFRYEFLSIAISDELTIDKTRRQQASDQMKTLGASAAFPLVNQGELMGYLLLGEKMSEEAYSQEDLLLLRIVANQAALAYQRVRYLEMAVRGARTEMLGQIAGGFAHEIKTPLANISLPAEMAYMDLREVEEGKRTFQEILPDLKAKMQEIMSHAFKVSDKVEAIRLFSKPGDTQLEILDINQVIQNSLKLIDHLIRKTAVKVAANFPGKTLSIRGSSKQLEIVFVNLIKNAAEAMISNDLANRNLLITISENGHWVEAAVKDSGRGIKKTDMGHLFDAYFTTKGHEGTGVGLFLSQQVIKAHGGSIHVDSEEGKGTTFMIRLPKFSIPEKLKGEQAA